MKQFNVKPHLQRKIGRIKEDWGDTSTPDASEVQSLVKSFRKYFKTHKKPDYIAAAGYSGCAIGTVISITFNIPLILLRNGHPHRSDIKADKKRKMITREVSINNKCAEPEAGDTYIFVDDLIDTGITFARIFTYLQNKGMKCLGVGILHSWMSQSSIDYCFVDEKGPKVHMINGDGY